MSDADLRRSGDAGVIVGALVAVPLTEYVGWWALLLAAGVFAQAAVRSFAAGWRKRKEWRS